MFKIIFEITKELLQITFIRRLIAVLLMPNVLVWGFNQVGIDNSRNFLWYMLVGPYWDAECLVFKVLFFLGLLLFILGFAKFCIEMKQKIDIERADAMERANDRAVQKRMEEKGREKPPVDWPPPELKKANESATPAPPPKPMTPEEVKWRALREMTGRDR